ncbi:MAG: malonyl-ACP O-methyltransferase BioC [Methylococcaceae bacterium]|nr:malonyl-ACP O-methyltransferase BioC [Methylococcaceae bacterium]
MPQAIATDFVIGEALPEKRWVGKSFSRAAAGYDGVAGLQRQVGEILLAQVREIPFSPRTILDLGTGTGYCIARLGAIFPQARLIALDLAEGMLKRTRERLSEEQAWLLCGDAEYLPLAEASVDLLFSNLALQWCRDLPAVFAGFRRVLRPGGKVLFTTFGEATLCELRAAWAGADGYSHVNAFASEDSIGKAMADSGWGECRIHNEKRILSYPDVDGLMRELKGLGAHNLTANRPRHLTGKGVFRKMREAYPLKLREGIEASFEVIFGCARRI